MMPPSDSEDESSEESGGEKEQQPKVVMIQVRMPAWAAELGAGVVRADGPAEHGGCADWP